MVGYGKKREDHIVAYHRKNFKAFDHYKNSEQETTWKKKTIAKHMD